MIRRMLSMASMLSVLAACQSPGSSAAPGAGASRVPPVAVIRDCSTGCPALAVIPAGSFIMGSPVTEDGRLDGSGSPGNAPGKPERELQHKVTFARPFALAVDPVTRAEFAAFQQASGYRAQGACFGINARGEASVSDAYGWQNPGFPQTDNDPVVCVTAQDAEAYARWLAQMTGKPYRLPTEAEYEYATRAGTTTARFWGDSADQGCAFANGVGQEATSVLMGRSTACNDGYVFTSPVGSFRPNPFGLNDMLGNVWVWMADCWHDTYVGAPSDGSAWVDASCTSRVMRGGSFISNSTSLRSAARHQVQNPAGRLHNYGIRVARSLS